MTPASSKDFLLKLLTGTDFKLNLAEAVKLTQSYKWLFELEPEVKKPQAIKKDSPIRKATKKASKKK